MRDSPLWELLAAATTSKTQHTVLVLLEVFAERAHQQEKGWTAEHDDKHTLMGLLSLITIRLGRAHGFSWSGLTRDVRRLLIQTAALCVATVEMLDRKHERREVERAPS